MGKLEGETQKLSEKVQQLEREKATLSLLNTEARYSFVFMPERKQPEHWIAIFNVNKIYK